MAANALLLPVEKKQPQLLKLPKQLKVNDELTYEWIKVLGKGGYAVAISAKRVYKDETKSPGPEDMVAVKTIVKNSFESGKMEQVIHYTKREIDIMSKLDHENIVKLYNHMQDDCCIYLILELCVNKTLSSLIKSDTYVLSNKQIRQLLYEMTSACEYMHGCLVVHRDLKPENVLLGEQFQAKIADFGLSMMLRNKHELLHTFCGTLKYQAPEMIERRGYSFGVDIWALGCIAYRLYYGNAPFDGLSSEEIYKAILTKNPKFVRADKHNHPIEAYEIALIKSALNKNADKRITAEQMLQNKRFFCGSSASSKRSTPRSTKRSPLKEISIVSSSLEPNAKLEAMLASMKAISSYDANKRVRITYMSYHDYQLAPKYWITEWIDINLFGFGYLFNKNIYGFNFKKQPHRRMMLLNGQSVVHSDGPDKLQHFQVSTCPENFQKDLSILKQSHRLLIEQIEQEGASYPEMEINLPKHAQLPWLEKKLFIGNSQLVAMAYLIQDGLIQITFVQNPVRIFLFYAEANSITIIKGDKLLTLGFDFILDGHLNEAMQNYVTESLKYIHLLLEQ